MENYFAPQLREGGVRAARRKGTAHRRGRGAWSCARRWVGGRGQATGKKRHLGAVALGKGQGRGGRGGKLLPRLTGGEVAGYKRGRNGHVHSVPPSASRADYLKATALECLLGYLYLHGATGRINQLFTIMMEETDDAT